MSTFTSRPQRDLGRVNSGSKHTLSFEFGETMDVVRVDSSCGCTLDEVDNVGKVIRLKFEAPEVPKHLLDSRGKGGYITTKSAVVFYQDTRYPGEEHQETLTFKVNIFQ